MLLVDGVAYRIEGNFYHGGVYRPIPMFFQGRILAGRLGSFSGVMFDEYGPSTVEGHLVANIEQNLLEFKKKYDLESKQHRGGSDLPINYFLIQEKSGGWTGTWKSDSGDKDDRGHVTLAIVPWRDDFPIVHDLVDYLALSRM